jgi:hypothetical protein
MSSQDIVFIDIGDFAMSAITNNRRLQSDFFIKSQSHAHNMFGDIQSFKTKKILRKNMHF